MAEFMETLTCYKCGIKFGAPEHWIASRRGDKSSFWCPNGHEQAFVKSTAEKLQTKLEAAEREKESANARLRELRARPYKCPCCQKRYVHDTGLLKHLKSVHGMGDKKARMLSKDAGPNRYNTDVS